MKSKISFPVHTDPDSSVAITGPLAKSLQIGTDFEVSLDEAVSACDRHVYVHGKPANPEQFVRQFVKRLREEISSLWIYDPVRKVLDRNEDLFLSWEHFRHSGELLAEGVAIEFLRQRLKIRRQQFFFYSGSEARPDLAIPASLKRKKELATTANGELFGLEARLRHGMASLSAADRRTTLKKKKHKDFARVIGVYLVYGDVQHRNSIASTRLHVVDPVNPDVESGMFKIGQQSAIVYYSMLCSQIGLWEHRDHLNRALELIDSPDELTPLQFSSNQIRTGVERKILGITARGREFNELIASTSGTFSSIEERDRAKQQAKSRVQRGDFGLLYFRGLCTDVLKLIEDNDWSGLAEYEMEPAFDQTSSIRDDGLAEQEFVINPGSAEARVIEQSI